MACAFGKRNNLWGMGCREMTQLSDGDAGGTLGPRGSQSCSIPPAWCSGPSVLPLQSPLAHPCPPYTHCAHAPRSQQAAVAFPAHLVPAAPANSDAAICVPLVCAESSFLHGISFIPHAYNTKGRIPPCLSEEENEVLRS